MSSINKNSTKFKFSSVSETNKCSTNDLEKIYNKSQFVRDLENNSDYVKVSEITGKDILYNVEPFHIISRNFYDTFSSTSILKQSQNGKKAISVKLYFDKVNEVFINLRSNDLYFALACATYMDFKDDKIDIYFNPKKEEAYFVNSNKQQYGYCKGISSDSLSNCEHIVYAELYKPSLSIQQKTKIFEKQEVVPILLSDTIIEESESLDNALIRQNKLIDIKESSIFYKLFIENIASYVYTYAEQISINGELSWKTKKNPKWSLDSTEGTFTNSEGWSNKNVYYIYDVRETFWINNQNMSIEEVLAYFVTKGGSKRDNSSYFRKLSQRILGVDYFLFSDKLFPILLEKGLICIENLSFGDSGQLKQQKFTYSFEYIAGDVYKKLDELNNLKKNIIDFYGQSKGFQIIDNQNALLNNAKPPKLSFGNQDQSLNLTINIHNPIFYTNKEGYVGRVSEDFGVFRDGKVRISTNEEIKDKYYKPLVLGGNSQIEKYKNFIDSEKDNRLNLQRNHLREFYEFLVFGRGVDEINNPLLKKNEFYIVDGYIFPMPSSKFITKHILPKYEKITDEGANIPCPMSFIDSLNNSQKTFTKTNIYNFKAEQYGNSYLTQESRENLINIGLVENKPKITGIIKIKDPKNPKEKISIKKMFTPISEEEGKRIFNVISDKYKRLESQIIIEGNTLFTTFCKIQLQPNYRQDIEELWNKTYNNMAIPNYDKFPIFCEHSRWFGNLKKPFLFFLRDAQVAGMKFAVANKNSGLLAHEVGFGKTTTSIAMISHMILTGESSRTIVFTPNQVYEKFADEIVGRVATSTLGLLTNWDVLERNKREGKKDTIDIIKFNNGSQKILMPSNKKGGYEGLKTYTKLELDVINKWKGTDGKSASTDDYGVLNTVRLQLINLPSFRPSFLPEDKRGTQNESRFSKNLRDSDYNDWYGTFEETLGNKIPEIYLGDDKEDDVIYLKIEEVLKRLDYTAQKVYDEIQKKYEEFRLKNRYTINDFVNENKSKITTYPKSVQEWWKKADPKANKNNPNYKIDEKQYPQKRWITDLDDAKKDGVINEQQYSQLKSNEKQLKVKWEGVLSDLGISEIRELENKLALEFFDPRENKNTGKITAILKQIENMLIDVLGQYKEEVLYPNKIILCTHQAIKRFRADSEANNKARMYVQNVESLDYVNVSTNRFFDNLYNLPLSFRKLNIDGICVDEIHNFNNLISKPREQILANVNMVRSGSSLTNNYFHILPTMNASAELKTLPDGTTINSGKGLKINEGTLYHNPNNFNLPVAQTFTENSYRLKYYSSGKSGYTTAPANLISLIFEIQQKEENKSVNNTILMSATPFTDNIFQMFSVFGMTNLDKMKESNISSVWDFFVTFVKEEWRYNITHRQTFGLFPEIQSYYNSAAMSNFIISMANFKVSDKIIEADRPLKYYIPQDGTGGDYQAGANTSAVQWDSRLQNVSSYIPLTPIQKEILNKIAQYVEGKIDIPFQYCPNYGEVIEINEETGEEQFKNDEVEQEIKATDKLKKEAGKFEAYSSEWDEILNDVRTRLIALRMTYPESDRIKRRQTSVDKLLFDTETIKEMNSSELLYDSNYEDLDLSANSKKEVRLARAIVGQGFGQMCVISPYLLKCDKTGDVPNDLLKDFPLDINDLSKSAKNFVENSPKIKYAIECAINTIIYDSKEGGVNDRQVGGQIIYVNRGKSMKYGGVYYNLYKLIQTYIVDRKISYYDNIKNKISTITEDNIGIITGGMSGEVDVTDSNGNKIYDDKGVVKRIGKREEIRDKFNDGRIKILIGSSAIKEGIDLNKRAHTLYVLDSDFSPSNAMQLEGRIWRQGNMWEFVRIVYVLGIDSIDAFVYSKLQNKINEIKQMLEQGVYELNRTQYTIDAKERIKNIMTDLDQLTDLEWQDKVDELNEKISLNNDKKSKLKSIKDKYGEVKDAFNFYIVLMNSLYSLVLNEEKIKLAQKEKNSLDIKLNYEWKVKSRGKGREWKQKNKPKLTRISEAIEIINKKSEDGLILLKTPNIKLNSDSNMTNVNIVAEKVRKLIFGNLNIIKNIFEFSDDDYMTQLSRINEESLVGQKIIKVYQDYTYGMIIKGIGYQRGSKFEEFMKEINQFSLGTEYERIMSNYSYLVKGEIKNDTTNEKYSYKDIDLLITKANNKIIEGQSELQSEKMWKAKYKKEEAERQIQKSQIRGDSLDLLIDRFNNSMSLLKIRVK